MVMDFSPVFQGMKRDCPKCGARLECDGKWSIWCPNPDCDYTEWVDDEPLDIGEVW